MANVFLLETPRDTKTALLLEQAHVHDIGKSVAYVDSKGQIFVNTEDNLTKLLPIYDTKILKWILWHERFHDTLGHHKRYFKYIKQLEKTGEIKGYKVTKEEVNIIMDILVHDKLCKEFPDVEEMARTNMFQFRDSNSLGYTFKTKTLEKMLDEYREYKTEDEEGEEEDKDAKGGEPVEDGDEPSELKETKKDDRKTEDKDKPKTGDEPKEEEEVEDTDDKKPEETTEPGRHDEVDWSKLEDINTKEFLTDDESEEYTEEINSLRRMKIQLGKLTETLNSLVTTTRTRTYRRPSLIQVSDKVIMKGKLPGRTELYLCFDASGSMGTEMNIFKDIISQSIPQALNTPCSWFSGYPTKPTVDPYKMVERQGFYKGTFQDFLPVIAHNGYDDDGDKTIDLCWEAEQQGYTPIGITDGGGRLSWSKTKLRELKRTILVSPSESWLKAVKTVNPSIQTLYIKRRRDY